MIKSLRSILAAAALVLAAGSGLHPAHADEILSPSGSAIRIDVGKGDLIKLDRNADTVFVADPKIADVRVKTPRLIYIFGKGPGETSLYAVDAEQHVITNKSVVVTRDTARLQAALDQLIPNNAVQVKNVDGELVLTGRVKSPAEAEDARRLARPFVEDDKQLINHIAVDAPNQVNLRVRVAEVQHNVIKELGINWDNAFNFGAFTLGFATGHPVIPPGSLFNSQFINLRNPGIGGTTNSFFGTARTSSVSVNAVIDALNQNGLVNILAEPNLTSVSGETASFLAGGEFPIPVPQSNGTGTTITVEYKPFGVALAFTPVILADGRISMRVRPEVSQISSTGQVQINGFNIPALTTRRAETTIELASGQTFALGGLLQNNIADTVNKVPGLGELPVLGPLFRSTQFQRNESELVILVTPYLVRPVSEQRLATPSDGYTPPNDLDMVLDGKTQRPSLPVGGKEPVGPEGSGAIGPAGFILQ
ncbi:MAG TPA: type II and III secretion system protein family protein [Stellaceae bacterium]|nr:type II and III secretion system protein family protein [Stellaceae bacterium]